MPILTLTTDYGLRDPFAGQLKGQLLCAYPQATVVDISHNIPPFSILEAAYVLSHTYAEFPKETVHICTVLSSGKNSTDLLCFRHNGYTFILPDNGLISLICEKVSQPVYRFTGGSDTSIKRRIAHIVRELQLGIGLAHLGDPVTDYETSITPRPITNPDFIRGSIIHIDRYDNAVLNVHRDLVERFADGRQIHTRFSNSNPIVGIVERYHEVPEGELLVRYNHLGYVELAINMGRAAQLFGLRRDQLVQLEFIASQDADAAGETAVLQEASKN